jgi:DNA polymerase
MEGKGITIRDYSSMFDKQALNQTLDEIHRTLRVMAADGYRGFDCSHHSLAKIEQWGQPCDDFAETLEDIRGDLGDCQRCRLAQGRTNIVFGAGHSGAKLVFIGEGPGFEEDQQGLPFVGAAGRLLTRIIEAIKLSRDQVYICNVIKCRPPGNRNPESDEIKTCFPFLERQIAAIQPDFIVALGTFAAQTLLETSTPISRLRKRFHEYKGIKVLPTYHPAYLLRNPDRKRDVWEDMKMLMGEYSYED